MKNSLSETSLRAINDRLHSSNDVLLSQYPGETGRRQPVHTVYGGAHLFRADSARRLGQVAERALKENAADFVVFARALGLPLSDQLPDVLDYATGLRQRLENDPEAVREENKAAWLAHSIYNRVQEKLRREPVEDFRIDFEDGYGNRPDEEEDGHAASAATEVAEGMDARHAAAIHRHSHQAVHRRTARAQHAHARHLCFDALREVGGKLPDNFVVTLPKITIPEQVAALVDIFELLEKQTGLPPVHSKWK